MEEIVNTVFGPMAIVPTDARIGEELKRKGCWDLREIIETIDFFERARPTNSKIILDIGCNVGAWTLPISRRYPDLTILSFDCQEYLIRCLNKTIDLNKIPNVQTKVMAISDQSGTIRYGSVDYTWGGNFGAFELEPPYHNSDFNGRLLPGKFEEVEQQTIDHFNLDNVGLIKIDVEGMELKVLAGAQETLQRCHPVVLFEHHKTNRQEVENLLRSFGYRIANSIGQMTCAVFNK